ncbi:MAG: FtsB family cell division protein [Elusimicrobiota bacterium]
MRKSGYKFAYIAAGVAVIVTVFSYSNIRRIFSLYTKLRHYNRQIEEVMEKNRQLEKEIRLIKSEEGHLEFLARKKLGMIKEGETKYYIVEDTGTEKKAK